jgi:HEAT repeat protein
VSRLMNRLLHQQAPEQHIHDLVAAGDVVALIDALGHERPEVRAKAAQALGQLGDQRALMPLVTFLAPDSPNFDQDVDARAAVKKALPNVATVDRLLEIINTADTRAQAGAVMALALLDDRKAVEPLLILLGDESADSTLRDAAAFALKELGDPRAIAPLVSFFSNGLRALDMKGYLPSPQLIDALVEKQFTTSAMNIIGFGSAATDELKAALRGERDDKVRMGLESVLKRIEPRGTSPSSGTHPAESELRTESEPAEAAAQVRQRHCAYLVLLWDTQPWAELEQDQVVEGKSAELGCAVQLMKTVRVTGPMPTSPDEYVIATARLACDEAGVTFDSQHDRISYRGGQQQPGVGLGLITIELAAA